jgi:hypothetical protein
LRAVLDDVADRVQLVDAVQIDAADRRLDRCAAPVARISLS